MSKRYLTVQNKGNENEEASVTNTTARPSAKRASTNDPIPAKKAKTVEHHVDQENQPAFSLVGNPLLPILHGLGLLKPSAYDADESDSDDDDDSSVTPDSNDQSKEEEQELPISSLADNPDLGKTHPTNKQYLVFKNPNPNNEDYIISKTARYWSLKYRKVLRHINPDAYGLYIHADFSCYGELEVVENCLRDLTRILFFVQQGVLNQPRKSNEKINYLLGFRRLEALTILLNYTDGIGGIDDGDRFYDIMRVIGACYVTILRGLLPKMMFEKIETIDRDLLKKLKTIARQIPNFKQVLEQALIVGHFLLQIGDVCSAYTKILQIVYCNWLFMMENLSIDFNQSTSQLNENIWKALQHAAAIDPNTIEHGGRESFQFLKELRSYKGKYGLGGEAFDLSKWSRNDRAQYSLRRSNLQNNFWFLP